MADFHKIWIEQCEAAQGIKEAFGIDKALGYLIGEKLLNFIRASNDHPEFAAEIPNFVAEIKRIFQPWEIREYLENIRRVGSFGHICSDEEVEMLWAAGAIEDNPVKGAEDVLFVDRIKELLIERI